MTYYVTAYISKNLPSVKEARVNCRVTADMIAKAWEKASYYVTRREEA